MLTVVMARQKGEDPAWTGDPELAVPAKRSEAAVALQETFGETPADPSTSASSPLEGSDEKLAAMTDTGDWKPGQRFSSGASQSTVTAWVNGLELLNPGIPAAAAPSIASN